MGRAGAVLGTAGGSGEAAGPAGQGQSQVQGAPWWCSVTPPGIPLHPGLAAQCCPSRSSLCLCDCSRSVQDALGPHPNQPHEQWCLQRPSLLATVPLIFKRSVLVSFAMKQHWKDITFNHKA